MKTEPPTATTLLPCDHEQLKAIYNHLEMREDLQEQLFRAIKIVEAWNTRPADPSLASLDEIIDKLASRIQAWKQTGYRRDPRAEAADYVEFVAAELNTRPAVEGKPVEQDHPIPDRDVLYAALKRLVDLKAHKDAHGKNNWYIKNQKDAWNQAIAAMETGTAPVAPVSAETDPAITPTSITFSLRDRIAMTEAVINPPEPSEAMVEMSRRQMDSGEIRLDANIGEIIGRCVSICCRLIELEGKAFEHGQKCVENLLNDLAPYIRTPEPVSGFPDALQSLRRLVALKEHKERHGKDTYYEFEQPIAWREAKAVLDAAEVKYE